MSIGVYFLIRTSSLATRLKGLLLETLKESHPTVYTEEDYRKLLYAEIDEKIALGWIDSK